MGSTWLTEWIRNADPKLERLVMVISGIEMPEMDGYTFTSQIRNNPQCRDTYVVLHTSLSGLFNSDSVRQVKANAFVGKFDAAELAKEVVKRL